MDPLAHTLAGASLAEAGLKRSTRLGGAALIIAANAPDIDAVAHFISTDFALGFRRGWTHGVLGMLVLPGLVAGILFGADRLMRWRRGSRQPPARFRALLGLSAIGVLSHPALDWLNTYGIRLLMPFDGRWFYGDSVFIIDPWLWLLWAAAPVLAFSRSPVAGAAWAALAAVATLLIFRFEEVPPAARGVWIAGLAGLVALRLAPAWRERVPAVARTCLAVAGTYIAVMVAGTLAAHQQAARWLEAQGTPASRLMAGPVPAHPFAREVIALAGDRYVFLEIDWLAGATPRVTDPSLPAGGGPIVEAALEAPSVRGIRRWLRFPTFEVQPVGDGYRVIIRDVRFARRSLTGIGTSIVDLDGDLRPLAHRGGF